MLPINKKISAYNHYNYNNPKYIILYFNCFVNTKKGHRQKIRVLFVD